MTIKPFGRTKRQIRDASSGAYYVWCNGDLSYPISLRDKLGRDDVNIVSRGWLNHKSNLIGVKTEIILDHAIDTSDLNIYDVLIVIKHLNIINRHKR